jgi:hypothetical protein
MHRIEADLAPASSFEWLPSRLNQLNVLFEELIDQRSRLSRAQRSPTILNLQGNHFAVQA